MIRIDKKNKVVKELADSIGSGVAGQGVQGVQGLAGVRTPLP